MRFACLVVLLGSMRVLSQIFLGSQLVDSNQSCLGRIRHKHDESFN
jgi:hypothetical protein